MHKKVIVIIKTNPWKRVEQKWEWLQKQTAGGKKKVHVIVGKHKLDNLRLHPFMTIFTSSVKETRNGKSEFRGRHFRRDPLQLQHVVLRPILHIQLWFAREGGAAFGSRSPVNCSPKKEKKH